jgi:sortase A
VRAINSGHALKLGGEVLLGAGLLLLSFVAYQLWGTALHEHSAQARLVGELSGRIAHPATIFSHSPPASQATTPPAPVSQVAPVMADPPLDAPIGLMSIPRLDMNGAAIVEGTGEHQLQDGPGHYAGTPLPGEAGNAGIAGHRTTYGAPFYSLDALKPGDLIYIQTSQGLFEYQVQQTAIVAPSDAQVLAATTVPELTLTTCNPRYSANQRLVVTAVLHLGLTSASFHSGSAPTKGGSSHTSPPALAGEANPTTGGEVRQAIAWAVLTLAAAALIVTAGRRLRRPWSLGVVAIGVPLTLGLLLACFAHVSLALPVTF